MEYSIRKDAAFCLSCHQFRTDTNLLVGGDAFVTGGFTAWNKKDRLGVYVGGPNSAHNEAWKKCDDLMNQNQHIESVFISNQKWLRFSIGLI